MLIEGQKVHTVSELTGCIKQQLEHKFSDVFVQGEISQFTRASSGHIYLTLKDSSAVLRAIIWRSFARRLEFDLEEGLEVVCGGSIDVYPPRGSYQMIIRDLCPCGMGSLQLAFRQLVERLKKEGLFDRRHKKPLPAYPQRIAILTSSAGAAVSDMLRIISRRWPVASLFLYPIPVQGKEAAGKITEALRRVNKERPEMDLLILGRGGGSLEDLWAFNEECVARAVFESSIPVISAVGHETDFSVCDFVADLRAATPSEAGENAVPDCAEILPAVERRADRMGQALLGSVKRSRQKLESLAKRHVLRHPETLLQDKIQRADELVESLQSIVAQKIERKNQCVEAAKGRLEALSPKKVLDRGYSITYGPDGRPLQETGSLIVGDRIRTCLRKGRIESLIEKTAEDRL